MCHCRFLQVITAVISGLAFVGLMVYVSLALKKAMARASQLGHDAQVGQPEQEPLLAEGIELE